MNSRTLQNLSGSAQPTVLVVEDDRTLREALDSALTAGGFQVAAVSDGAAAGEALRTRTPDIVLLDIGLPFVDGWSVLAGMRGARQPPVIIISARGDQQDKVRALNMGADDYLAKPFGSEELLARIRAVLRRAQPPAMAPRVVRCQDVTVDLGKQTVFRGGNEVSLSPTEFLLLAELARHAHQVLEHRTLLQRVWGPTYGDERQYLRTFVQRLRNKLEADPAQPRVIETVPGRGYRFGPATEGEAGWDC